MKVLKLMAEYGCFPLWGVSPEVGNIDPDELPISYQLKRDLDSWALKYDKTLDVSYPPDSGFLSESEEAEFRREGECLLERLKLELGAGYSVIMVL